MILPSILFVFFQPLLGAWSEVIEHSSGTAHLSSSKSDENGSRPKCSCAVLYSGHVRSFVQPSVYISHRRNLIEPLEEDCAVDVYMYLSGASVVAPSLCYLLSMKDTTARCCCGSRIILDKCAELRTWITHVRMVCVYSPSSKNRALSLSISRFYVTSKRRCRRQSRSRC